MKSSRLELRIDPGLHERVKQLAKHSGTNTSQLVEGLLAWAVDHGYPGLPAPVDPRNPDQFESVDEPGVWFGFDGLDSDGLPDQGGCVFFVLDFRPGRSVRSGMEFEL